jgi:hypothetical protein
MTIAHHLRGYHRQSGYLGAEFAIADRMLPDVRAILREAEDYPDLIDPYELARDQAFRLAEVLGFIVDPDLFDYFVEAEEDWRVVAVMRDARFVEV